MFAVNHLKKRTHLDKQLSMDKETSQTKGLSDISAPSPWERELKGEATILIFEDEVYNFRLLRHQLLELNPDYDVIGPISTVEEGRAFLSYHHDIDLIIADIQLNDGLSFDALSYAPDNIPIIFTTAYDEYALKAFEYNSLSYLLKPVDDAKLRKAIQKALMHAGVEAVSDTTAVRGGEASVFKSIATDSSHRQCFLARTPRGERRVHVSMVRYAVSEDKTTYIHLLDGTSYSVELTLTELSAELDPARFMRVNRKFILPLQQVKGMEHLPNGRIQLLLYGTDSPDIIVSRERRKAVMAWIGR